MKQKTVELPNLADITYAQALTLARLLSGKTYAEIAERMEKGTETIRRYFTDPSYNPPSCLVPKLCSVLGNFILIEWQCIHAGGQFVPPVSDMSIRQLEIMLAELTKELSDVLHEDGMAREDGKYDDGELSKIQKEVTELLRKGHQVLNMVRAERGR